MTMKQVARLGAGDVFQEVQEVEVAADLAADQFAELPPDLSAPKGAWVLRDGAWLRRCAQVDPNGVYLGMVEVAPEAIGAQHLIEITECDLKPRSSKWVPEANPKNPYGGTFQPLPPSMQPKDDDAPSDQQLLYALLGALERQGIALPAEAAPWRAWFEKTIEAPRKGKG